ncbi:hypothetical protein ACFSCX_10500 [Bacillus salitolerans]|uniref:Aspartate kinase n=1 Tax=Bacillus salitolerans TaxID=1437434 RepID=A0ABW4LSD2_9BACI
METISFGSKDLKIAGSNILRLISKAINVNTFCITSINDSRSYFMNVLNRHTELAKEGTIISVYDAY